ncbi:zinc-binding metallopeptidase family protein [Maribacter cobaltidurans]|uniref:Zinc-ribbon domain-containing protein n=1 Tax=Maribacter cobaltidurans TaxID=1178778 RepID=A0A223V6Z3_9FLAO|nr:putative zinc-binding metallopeptidase [Maribacter cobaltidurans]ASV30599.1 hypothetical protein CJ263_10460 [Maribacter cobaltidurans]
MKLFQCSNCNNTLAFENNICVSCEHFLGYSSYYNQMVPLPPTHSRWKVPSLGEEEYIYCSNNSLGTCNWLIPSNEPSGFCLACSLNRTIPDLGKPENVQKWKSIEFAKHRLVYQLLRLRLPIVSKTVDPENGLCFDFLSREDMDKASNGIKTGHANGVITILISEADAVVREQVKQEMEERYRTLLGHFRHEVGHYFWDRLVWPDQNNLQGFRNIFGDETISYTESLQTYYNEGPKQNWQGSYISKYASSHPWEDWAETWSHYLHLMDALETANSFGLSLNPRLNGSHKLTLDANFDPYLENDFNKILDSGIPLLYAMNSMNRSMGEEDPYPFIISDPVKTKLEFIHNLLKRD